MKTGLKDPRPGAIPLRFATYVDYSKLPTPPPEFGHMHLIEDWGMLGNDTYGDCAPVGGIHQTEYFCALGQTDAPFSTETALKNYSEITGFSLVDPQGVPYPLDRPNPTDKGTDLGDLAAHWQNVGLVDDNGKRHKIVAAVDFNPGDLRELWVASYLFSVTLGFALPDSAEEQTQRGLPWDVVPGATIVGGHCVPAFSKLAHYGVGVTWGQPQLFTPRFFQTYNNQGFVGFSEEMLHDAKSIDGFDDALLRDDLAELAKAA